MSADDKQRPAGTPSWAVIAATVILTMVVTFILFIVVPLLFGYHVYIEKP